MIDFMLKKDLGVNFLFSFSYLNDLVIVQTSQGLADYIIQSQGEEVRILMDKNSIIIRS